MAEQLRAPHAWCTPGPRRCWSASERGLTRFSWTLKLASLDGDKEEEGVEKAGFGSLKSKLDHKLIHQRTRETRWVTSELHSCAKDDPVFTHTPLPARCLSYNGVVIYQELIFVKAKLHILLVLIRIQWKSFILTCTGTVMCSTVFMGRGFFCKPLCAKKIREILRVQAISSCLKTALNWGMALFFHTSQIY